MCCENREQLADIFRTKEKLSLLLERVFESESIKLDRSLRLVRLALRRVLGQELLADCKEYWQHHSQLASCFTDIRQSVELLNTEDRAEFLQFIEEHTRDSAPTADEGEVRSSFFIYKLSQADSYKAKVSGLGKR